MPSFVIGLDVFLKLPCDMQLVLAMSYQRLRAGVVTMLHAQAMPTRDSRNLEQWYWAAQWLPNVSDTLGAGERPRSVGS